MNIIIPLGGIGRRFKEDGYIYPKPLINILGKPMIFHVLDNLILKKEDNLFIIYNKELNKYSFNTIIKNKYNNINLIELTKQTDGPTETILNGLNNIPKNLLNKKFILLDSDTFYNIDVINIFRNEEKNLIFSFKDNQDHSIYSYLNIDENNIIVDIKEKVKISDYASTGCYCFNNGIILKKYCEKIINSNIRENNEYYISCVIKEMLNDNHIIKNYLINHDNFSCVGTPLQLKIYCSNFNYVIDKKRFCFDLDNTLVTSPEIPNDYSSVKPIYKNIEYLRYLKNVGHYIIIYTARRMKTHKSNVGLILKDISKVTFETLEKFDIPYDELYFGKPYADFYIDDLAINAYEDLEKQTGIYKTYIKERDFNEIITDKMDIIVKKSNNNKINGEIYYYKNIPNEIKKYFPIFIDSGKNWYSIEKIKGITLSYLYVNESLYEDILHKYLKLFLEIHNLRKNNDIDKNNEINIYDNYVNKIKERYNNFDYSRFKNSKETYEKLINYFTEYEEKKYGVYGIIHGDAVFSNCIIDKNNNFKLIDMRGKLNETLTIYGDILYDYSKIYQSLLGYDEILLDKIVSNDYKTKLMNIFIEFIKNNLGEEYLYRIKMICNSLLFTLIPLHNNEKCEYFYNLIKI
jgi:capsule biosynthesis phosphatase